MRGGGGWHRPFSFAPPETGELATLQVDENAEGLKQRREVKLLPPPLDVVTMLERSRSDNFETLASMLSFF